MQKTLMVLTNHIKIFCQVKNSIVVLMPHAISITFVLLSEQQYPIDFF